jgi:hypothetical protein
VDHPDLSRRMDTTYAKYNRASNKGQSTSGARVPFYEHRGFSVLRTLQLPYGAPKIWTMWCEPEGTEVPR